MLKIVHAAALTVAAALLAASPAAADPFQSFLKACVTTDGDAAAAIAAVGALGWKAMPAEAFGEDLPAEMENVTIHLNFDPQGESAPESVELLMTGQADGEMVLDAPSVKMDICGVVAPGADAATLLREATAYLGGPPQMVDGDYTAWIYSRQNGQITLEGDLADAEDDAILAALRERPLFAVFTLDEDGAAGLMLGAFRSTKGAAR
ncbi:MAG: hypothetical protein ACK4UQ_12685 [Brevundimonas sp.]